MRVSRCLYLQMTTLFEGVLCLKRCPVQVWSQDKEPWRESRGFGAAHPQLAPEQQAEQRTGPLLSLLHYSGMHCVSFEIIIISSTFAHTHIHMYICKCHAKWFPLLPSFLTMREWLPYSFYSDQEEGTAHPYVNQG